MSTFSRETTGNSRTSWQRQPDRQPAGRIPFDPDAFLTTNEQELLILTATQYLTETPLSQLGQPSSSWADLTPQLLNSQKELSSTGKDHAQQVVNWLYEYFGELCKRHQLSLPNKVVRNRFLLQLLPQIYARIKNQLPTEQYQADHFTWQNRDQQTAARLLLASIRGRLTMDAIAAAEEPEPLQSGTIVEGHLVTQPAAVVTPEPPATSTITPSTSSEWWRLPPFNQPPSAPERMPWASTHTTATTFTSSTDIPLTEPLSPPEKTPAPDRRKRRRRLLRRVALLASLGLLAGMRYTGIDVYAWEIGKALFGANAQTADVDDALVDEMLGGKIADATPETNADWLAVTPAVGSVDTDDSPKYAIGDAYVATAVPTATSGNASPETPVATPQATPAPTEQTAPVEQANKIEQAVVSTEANTFTEFMFGGEFLETVIKARRLRLGQLELSEIPSGWRQTRLVSPNGSAQTFLVPEELPSYLEFVYAPSTIASSLGVFEVTEANRAAYLEALASSPSINIVLTGLDFRPHYFEPRVGFAGRADITMIASINTQTGQVTLVSIPRYLLSPEVSKLTGYDLDASLFNIGTWTHGNPYIHTDTGYYRWMVENVCGCFVDGVIEFNFAAGAEYIDALFPDGVEITVDDRDAVWVGDQKVIQDKDIPGWSIPVGTRVLHGQDLVNYARVREAMGDQMRQDRQRQILSALLRQLVVNMIGDLENGQINDAVTTFDRIIADSQTTYQGFEANRQAMVAQTARPAEIGYAQDFGSVTPDVLLAHLANVSAFLLTPEGVGTVVSILQAEGMTEMMGFKNGTSIQVHSANQPVYDLAKIDSYLNRPYTYWRITREEVQGWLGLPSASSFLLSSGE